MNVVGIEYFEVQIVVNFKTVELTFLFCYTSLHRHSPIATRFKIDFFIQHIVELLRSSQGKRSIWSFLQSRYISAPFKTALIPPNKTLHFANGLELQVLTSSVQYCTL